MELKLDFSNEECEAILLRYGYKIEEMCGWFDSESYMVKDHDDCVNMSCTNIMVAYLPCEEDDIKSMRYPLLSMLKEHSCEKVVNDIVKREIMRHLLGIF